MSDSIKSVEGRSTDEVNSNVDHKGIDNCKSIIAGTTSEKDPNSENSPSDADPAKKASHLSKEFSAAYRVPSVVSKILLEKERLKKINETKSEERELATED